MKYWVLFLGILITSPVFAKCKIDDQKFGTSSKIIEKILGEFYGVFERIPNFQKEVTVNFDTICSKLESTLGKDTTLSYHFIKDQLVAIELVRQTSNDLLLFEWGREHFGIVEDRNINESEQVIQVKDGDRIIQLFVGMLPEAVFQNVVLISTLHDDLFDLLAAKEDNTNWDTFEHAPLEPFSGTSEGN